MPDTVLEAIKQGVWDYEPSKEDAQFERTAALPGSDEKLQALIDRIERGLPLWHPKDRRTYDDIEA